MKKATGHLVISLDFELYWGMFDRLSLAEYGANVRGVRTAIPAMLELFARDGIRATWATVGMLMAESKTELESVMPPANLRPRYADARMSAYRHLESGAVGADEASDPYHFGASLLSLIASAPAQEIGSHTFSHYYAIDGRVSGPEAFDADCEAFAAISRKRGVEATSMVFPRNQTDPTAIETLRRRGFSAYRGTESHVLYRSRGDDRSSLVLRAFRLLDHYVNISGHHTYPLPARADIVDVPASRFLRPYSRRLALLEPLRRRRIKRAMTRAAMRGEIFHLWWHPHNFGIDQRENLATLEDILAHYRMLRDRYGMRSSSMRDIVALTRASE